MQPLIAGFLVGLLGLALSFGAVDAQAGEPISSPGAGNNRASQQADDRDERREERTVLAIQGTRFTLDGKPTFLLGISEYGALGAPKR